MPVPDRIAEIDIEQVHRVLAGLDTSHKRKEPKRGEEIFEGVDYPREFAGFVGQVRAKAQLQAQIASSTARGRRMEHTLLETGLHGVGKSTLATIFAYQRGVGLQQTAGPLTVDDARDLILTMDDHDVLFIDEAHLLTQGGSRKADWLLPFMTEGKLYTERGAEAMPDITVVAATTDVGRLPLTLISRFMCRPTFVAYTEEEAVEIVFELAVRMGVEADVDYAAIARAANRNPRAARMILTQVRDLSYAFPGQPVDLSTAFEWAGLS